MSKYDDEDDFEQVEDDISDDDEIDANISSKNKLNKMKPKFLENDDENEEDDDDDNENIDDIDDDDDNENDEDENFGEMEDFNEKKQNEIKSNFPNFADLNDEEDDDEEDDDDEPDENYLQKFDENLQKNIISEWHPELQSYNYDEIDVLTRIVRDSDGNIIDPLHKTLPFITRYETARILGERAKQINSGAKPFVNVENGVIDGYLIALEEYKQKKIPFIIARPLPNNGIEFWKFKDLEIIS